MSKKLLMSVAPLLAVAAFAVMPALASAQTYGTCSTGTTSSNCPSGQKFTAFTEFIHEEVRDKKVGTSPFVLENETETAGIECKSFKSIGYVWNVAGTGMSEESLNFDECKPTKGLAEMCEAVNAKNNHEIQGSITNEVTGAAAVKITISEGFNVKCLDKGVEVELGNVTGTATGTQAAKSAVLKFAKAKGLEFALEKDTITGEAETETIVGAKKVYI